MHFYVTDSFGMRTLFAVSVSWLVAPVSSLLGAGSPQSVLVETKLHLSKHWKVEKELLSVHSHKSWSDLCMFQ